MTGLRSGSNYLDQVLQERTAEGDFSGVVVIQRDQHQLYSGAFGLANRSWNIPNQIDTRFRVASISKIFTAAAVLQLIEHGLVHFDDSIVRVLNLQNTSVPNEVNIFHLLTMTSGIADWFEESGDWEAEWEELIRRNPIYLLRKNKDYLPLFLDSSPIFTPGERFQYNSSGYILLGLLIEKLTGQAYSDYIRDHIFHRAGMHGSSYIALDDIASNVAEGYIPRRAEEDGRILAWKKNIYSITPAGAADGGAISTGMDLVLFSQALRSGKLFSIKTTREMLSPQVMEQEERVRGYTWMYGYGMMFLLDSGGKVVRWGHTGEEGGASCRLFYYPAFDLDVVILGNQSWCAGRLAWEIHDVLTSEQR